MSNELVVRNMSRSEVDELVDWAAREGWNPGLHDADLFWATDPAAFIAADLDGELIGGGAITSYHGEFGFMGFFIVRPEFRGQGFGNALWHARRERLLARLRPGASIGLDGVFAMQDYYAAGKRPVGWYTGRISQNTRRLVLEDGGFLYSSDAYNDDLPYWLAGLPAHLVIPYTLVNNDAHYLLPNGFSSGEDFFRLLQDAFDLLWQEGAQRPKMMSVGLHGRISCHPARAMALARFLDYVQRHDSVWIYRREEIARHWMAEYPP